MRVQSSSQQRREVQWNRDVDENPSSTHSRGSVGGRLPLAMPGGKRTVNKERSASMNPPNTIDEVMTVIDVTDLKTLNTTLRKMRQELHHPAQEEDRMDYTSFKRETVSQESNMIIDLTDIDEVDVDTMYNDRNYAMAAGQTEPDQDLDLSISDNIKAITRAAKADLKPFSIPQSGPEARDTSTHDRVIKKSDSDVVKRLRAVYESRPDKNGKSLAATSKSEKSVTFTQEKKDIRTPAGAPLVAAPKTSAVGKAAVQREAHYSEKDGEDTSCIPSTNRCFQDFTEDVSYGLNAVNDEMIAQEEIYAAQEEIDAIKGKLRKAEEEEAEIGFLSEVENEAKEVFVEESNGENAGQAGEFCYTSSQAYMQNLSEGISTITDVGMSSILAMREKRGESETKEESTTERMDSEAIKQEAQPHVAEEMAANGTSLAVTCVTETQDCMQSFKEDVTYVACGGFASDFSQRKERQKSSEGEEKNTLSVEGGEATSSKTKTSASGKAVDGELKAKEGFRLSCMPSDDDSGILAAAFDCLGTLKEDVTYTIDQVKDVKISEVELRGIIVGFKKGLTEPCYVESDDELTISSQEVEANAGKVSGSIGNPIDGDVEYDVFAEDAEPERVIDLSDPVKALLAADSDSIDCETASNGTSIDTGTYFDEETVEMSVIEEVLEDSDESGPELEYDEETVPDDFSEDPVPPSASEEQSQGGRSV